MATRPCFRPLENVVGYKTVESGPFVWNGGFALSQKQKNVVALHEAIRKADPSAKVLEISDRSLQPLGVSLSIPHLRMHCHGAPCMIESVFLASQIFAGGVGPFPRLCSQCACDVALFVGEVLGDPHVVGFELDGERWDAKSRLAFFFHLYLKALGDNPELADGLMEYDAFTDIEFNPKRQINCQAAAAAFYVSLRSQNILEWAMQAQENLLCICR